MSPNSPTPDAHPSATPDWPFDMQRVIAGMPSFLATPAQILTTLAEALTELGYPARAWTRRVEAMLCEAGGDWNDERPALIDVRNEHLEALELDGMVLNLELDAGWDAALLRFHRATVGADHERNARRPQEWETSYVEAKRLCVATPGRDAIVLAQDLLRAHLTPGYVRRPAAPDPVSPEVRELLGGDINNHATAFAVAAALRQAGIAARPMLELTERALDGCMENRERVWVAYGQPEAELAINDLRSEEAISYSTANQFGALQRDLSFGIHEISAEHMGEPHAPTMERCAALVAKLVQEALDRQVLQAGGVARPRM